MMGCSDQWQVERYYGRRCGRGLRDSWFTRVIGRRPRPGDLILAARTRRPLANRSARQPTASPGPSPTTNAALGGDRQYGVDPVEERPEVNEAGQADMTWPQVPG